MRKEAIIFGNFKDELMRVVSLEELEILSRNFNNYRQSFGIFEEEAENFLNIKKEIILSQEEPKEVQITCNIKKEDSKIQIDSPTEFKPLKFNLKGLESLKSKIDRIKSPKLKYEFEGLFNLLSDSHNLVYNELWLRQKIIDDLNKFKSLNYHKCNYISPFYLKKDYKHLSYKNDCLKFFTKVIRVSKTVIVLKTMLEDSIQLKAFCTSSKGLKKVVNLNKSNKTTGKVPKVNLSSLEAYKTLKKEDSIAFYNYCNNNGLYKKNRQLLKSIRKTKGGLTFDLYLESLEESICEIKAKIAFIDKKEDSQALYLEKADLISELEAITKKLESFSEEKNSDQLKTGNTLIGDYNLYEYS